jgi:hypothetical protein
MGCCWEMCNVAPGLSLRSAAECLGYRQRPSRAQVRRISYLNVAVDR